MSKELRQFDLEERLIGFALRIIRTTLESAADEINQLIPIFIADIKTANQNN